MNLRSKQKLQILSRNALAWSELSTCDRLHAGAVIFTPDFHQISQGYNGSLPGFPHCDQSGHEMIEGHCVRTLHAEGNALAQAKRLLGNLSFMHILSTHYPCLLCTKEIIREGITHVYYLNPYGREEELRIARGLYLAARITTEHLVLDI
jgi:dCMP deaminase